MKRGALRSFVCLGGRGVSCVSVHLKSGLKHKIVEAIILTADLDDLTYLEVRGERYKHLLGLVISILS